MGKVLRIGVIALPIIMFLAIFGNQILIYFIETENDQIDAGNEMLDTLVGGDGWTAPGGWSATSE